MCEETKKIPVAVRKLVFSSYRFENSYLKDEIKSLNSITVPERWLAISRGPCIAHRFRSRFDDQKCLSN
jgi:hypothetical protein